MARALITGCSTGFGRATAVELKKRGYEVVATARRPETLADLDADERLALDVTDDASVAAAVADAGPIDVLVNNAGISVGGPIELVPLAEVRRLFETNVFGAVAHDAGRAAPDAGPDGGCDRERVVGVGPGRRAAVGLLRGVEVRRRGHVRGVAHRGRALRDPHHRHRARILHDQPLGVAPRLRRGRAPRTTSSPSIMAKLSAQLGRGTAAPGPEVVATAIADALESPGTPWRVPVGTDAEMVLGARAASDDAAFEKACATCSTLDW